MPTTDTERIIELQDELLKLREKYEFAVADIYRYRPCLLCKYTEPVQCDPGAAWGTKQKARYIECSTHPDGIRKPCFVWRGEPENESTT